MQAPYMLSISAYIQDIGCNFLDWLNDDTTLVLIKVVMCDYIECVEFEMIARWYPYS